MEKQDRSAITARHPHHEPAQDRHAEAPVIAAHHLSDPRVETAMRPIWLRFEDDGGLPGIELEVHDQLDPLIAGGTTRTGDATMLGRSIVPRAWRLNPRQTD